MQYFDGEIERLIRQGTIAYRTGMLYATNPDNLRVELADYSPDDADAWSCRNDPFSSYRSGFEVRTYRLCQRFLMFGEQAMEGRRHGALRADRARALGRLGGREHLHHLLGEQRDPAGGGAHLLDALVVDRHVTHRFRQLAHVLGREGAELDLHARLAPPGPAELLAMGDHAQDGKLRKIDQDPPQQLDRGGIGPLQVLHHQQHRVLGGVGHQQRLQRAQQRGALLLRVRGPITAGVLPGQREQIE